VCIIVYKPEGKAVDLDTLRRCWDKNKDGAGVMFAHNNELRVVKGMMKWRKFKKFWKSLGPLQESVPMVLHFRIATHGLVEPKNTHPFKVNEVLGFAHNGIISNATPEKEWNITDTEFFNSAYLQPLDETLQGGLTVEWLDQPWAHNLISEYVKHSKLVFLNASGEATIINETQGYWDEGVWYSNAGYKPPSKPVVTSAKDWTAPRYQSYGLGQNYGSRSGAIIGFQPQRDRPVWDKERKELVLVGEDDEPIAEVKIEDDEYYCVACQEFSNVEDMLDRPATGGTLTCPMCGESDVLSTDSEEFFEEMELLEEEQLEEEERNGWDMYSDEYFACAECREMFSVYESTMWAGLVPMCPKCGSYDTMQVNID
jgi:transcription elongation factor Elf1